ncbi:hypothetical protein K1719_029171 [Acacia pycnantha]|nr:hypothetical protein K1719_029171 [Acacia pycnantha]
MIFAQNRGKHKMIVAREGIGKGINFLTQGAERRKYKQARRAFRALKAVVRLQAIFGGRKVGKQAAITLRCLHVLVKVQARVKAMNAEEGWCNILGTVDVVKAKIQMKQEAVIKWERAIDALQARAQKKNCRSIFLNDEGLFYALVLGGTNFCLLGVQLSANINCFWKPLQKILHRLCKMADYMVLCIWKLISRLLLKLAYMARAQKKNCRADIFLNSLTILQHKLQNLLPMEVKIFEFLIPSPSLAVYSVAQYARYKMKIMEAEVKQKRKLRDEQEAKEREKLEKLKPPDPPLQEVKVRLDKLEEAVKEIVAETKKQSSSKIHENHVKEDERKNAKSSSTESHKNIALPQDKAVEKDNLGKPVKPKPESVQETPKNEMAASKSWLDDQKKSR